VIHTDCINIGVLLCKHKNPYVFDSVLYYASATIYYDVLRIYIACGI
jgi:hypothetical protein